MSTLLHLDLKRTTNTTAELRVFRDNPNGYESRSLNLSEVDDLVGVMERDYYVSMLPEDYGVTGRRLYRWLDGAERFLARAIEQISGPIVLVMGAGEGFGQLAWEVLADERGFLVDRGIVIVRSVCEGRAVTIGSVAKPYQLNLLLMAAAPMGGGAALAFEQEEGRILAATRKVELQLVVEESGCLAELEQLVTDYIPEGGGVHFDVFHLTGHATIDTNGVPLFQLETETGSPDWVTAREIAGAFGSGFPAVVFLSGCLSGKQGAESSMAEALVRSGAGAVLGWGQSVLDNDAIVAAEILYRELAAGQSLAVAIGKTVSGMREQGCRDWHLLRVFVGDRMPGSLVTGKMKRKAQKKMRFAKSEFLDVGMEEKVLVASRRTFVGRRRVLQAGLRSLKWESEKVGLWIHGMGGLGKSSVAARLCDSRSGRLTPTAGAF